MRNVIVFLRQVESPQLIGWLINLLEIHWLRENCLIGNVMEVMIA